MFDLNTMGGMHQPVGGGGGGNYSVLKGKYGSLTWWRGRACKSNINLVELSVVEI